jgi:hypothetical protein
MNSLDHNFLASMSHTPGLGETERLPPRNAGKSRRDGVNCSTRSICRYQHPETPAEAAQTRCADAIEVALMQVGRIPKRSRTPFETTVLHRSEQVS